jgi:hypothetical protein
MKIYILLTLISVIVGVSNLPLRRRQGSGAGLS